MSDVYKYFSRAEVLKGHDSNYPLDDTMEGNLLNLLQSMNQVRESWGNPMIVTSGYRPLTYNLSIGGSERSAHITCEALDIYDPDKRLAKWCLDNLDILEESGLYIEDPDYTSNWVHFTTRAPRSGRRVFIP